MTIMTNQEKPLEEVQQMNVKEEEDDGEPIICTHLLTTSFPATPPPEPEPTSSSSSESPPPPKYENKNSGDGGGGNGNGDGPGFAGEAARTIAIAGAAGAAVPTVATAGIAAAGFTGSGIAAGSMAAASQAAIGNVVAGSTFATLQSIGATGGFAILGPVGIGAAAVVGGGFAAYRWWNRSSKPSPPSPPPTEGKENVKPEIVKDVKDNLGLDLNSKQEPIRGVTVCDECWKRMQIRRYNELCKKGKANLQKENKM